MAACQGCSVMSLSRPPKIRNEGRFRELSVLWPHVPTEEDKVKKKKQNLLNCTHNKQTGKSGSRIEREIGQSNDVLDKFEYSLPLLLLFVVGPRGPRVVMTDGCLAKNNKSSNYGYDGSTSQSGRFYSLNFRQSVSLGNKLQKKVN